MAVDAKIGIVKLQISQAIPQPKPDPNNPVSFLSLGSDGNIRTLVNTAVSNTPMPLDKAFKPAGFRYNFPSSAANVPATVKFELTMQLDGEYKKFYFAVAVTRDTAAHADTLTIDNPNQQISDGAATVTLVGLSWINGITSDSITVPWGVMEVAVSIVMTLDSTPLVGSACGNDVVFDTDNDCGCEPICQLLPITDYINCDVPIPPEPPPIQNCGLPQEPPEPIVNPVPPGEPGEPGEPTPPGEPGEPGDPGPPGSDGCTPTIYWSSSTVVAEDCSTPFEMSVYPIGECSYWVHVTFYRCYSDDYYGDNCCDFIYCGSAWQPLGDHAPCDGITPPSAAGEDGEVRRKCTCAPLSTTTAPCYSKLWVARINESQLAAVQAAYPGVVATGRTSINPSFVYVGVCSDEAPTVPSVGSWYNMTSVCLAYTLGDSNFLPLEPDPTCCLTPPPCVSTTTSGTTTTSTTSTTTAATTTTADSTTTSGAP